MTAKTRSTEQTSRSDTGRTRRSPSPSQATAFSQHQNGLFDLQQAAGNLAIQRLLRTGAIQTKLTLNRPGDVYEQEADRVAEQVTRRTKPLVQRTCACGGTCPKCREEEPPSVQREAETATGSPSVPSSSAVIPSGGHPLDRGTRTFFERRFGHDFGGVRVHTGATANALASSLRARAYTSGTDIVFGEGQYQPHRSAGQRLLAHELTHVVQADVATSNPMQLSSRLLKNLRQVPKSGLNRSLSGVFPQSPSSVDALEREAQQVATAFPSGGIVPPIFGMARTPAVPLRQGDPGAPTFGNLPGDEPQPAGIRRVKLIYSGGKWREVASGRTPPMRTAKGAYDFVVMEGGNIWAVKSSSHLGHTEAARGQRVKWAGHIQFSNRGDLKRWTNASGHYLPSGAFAKNAGLPMDKFEQSYRGPVVRPGGKREGPQLPTFQPKEGEILDPPRGTVRRPGSTESVRSGQVVSGEITTPASPTTTAGVKGGGGGRPASGLKGLKGATARIGRGLGRFFGTVGRGVGRALPALPAIGELVQAYDYLTTFFAAKAQVEEMKRRMDALWAEVDAILAELDAMWSRQSTGTGQTPAVTTPARPDWTVPKRADITQWVQVYNISRGRLTEKETQVSEDALRSSYYRISFSSLTNLSESIYYIAPSQFDCQGVRGTGLGGIRQVYKFDGYAERGDYKKLKTLLQTQLRLIRLSCLLKGLSEGTLGKEEEPPRPDGDRITVHLDWIEGSVSESITATCEGPGADGPWICGAEGDFESLKRVTEDEDAETLPDYILYVDYSRVAGGQTTNWAYSITSWIDNPDHPAPEPTVILDGELPEGVCQASRYPIGSVLAYVLSNYAYDCQ